MRGVSASDRIVAEVARAVRGAICSENVPRLPVLRKYSIRSQVLPLKPKAGNRCTIPADDELPWLDWHPNSLGHCSRYATPHILGCPAPLAGCSRDRKSTRL